MSVGLSFASLRGVMRLSGGAGEVCVVRKCCLVGLSPLYLRTPLARPWHASAPPVSLHFYSPRQRLFTHTLSPKPRPCSLGSRGLQATLVSRDVPAVSQSRLSPPGMTIIAGFICCYLNQAQAPCSCRSQRARRDRKPLLLLVSATPRPDGGFQSGRHGATQRSARH